MLELKQRFCIEATSKLSNVNHKNNGRKKNDSSNLNDSEIVTLLTRLKDVYILYTIYIYIYTMHMVYTLHVESMHAMHIHKYIYIYI